MFRRQSSGICLSLFDFLTDGNITANIDANKYNVSRRHASGCNALAVLERLHENRIKMTSAGSRLLVLLAIMSSAIRGLSDSPVLGSPTKGIGSRTSEGQRKDLTRTKKSRLTCPFEAQDESPRANSFLWTVNGRQRPSFFFGTIHVPYSLVWSRIPSNAKAAFRRSDDLRLELDLLDPETIAGLYRCQLLPHGESLADVVPRSLLFRLRRHLQYVRRSMPRWLTPAQRGRGLVADYLFDALTGNWERRRPIYVTMMVNSLTEADVRLRGIPVLDLYLAQEARRMKKKRGAVERVEEHCLPLNELNLSQAIFILNRTLWYHELHRFDPSSADFLSSSPLRPRASSPSSSSSSSAVTSDDLVHHYNCGDLSAIWFAGDSVQFPNLVESSGSPLPPPRAPSLDRPGSGEEEETTARQIDDYFREELIFKRNEKMAERVDRLLITHPNTSFFFAFGAGHFIGNNSVIEILQRRGHNITHTPPTRSSSPENRGKHNSERRKGDDRRWFQSVSDRSETDDSLHRKRSRFNDLWIRHDNNRFKFGEFVHQQNIHDMSPVMSMTASRSPSSVVMSSTSSLSSLVTTAVVVTVSLSAVVVFTA